MPPPILVRLGLESLEDRTVPYAVSGNAWPKPALVTVSFVPDGTLVNGVASNLQATFNAKFGAAATWQNVFKEAAQVWAQQTNINFNFVTDSGAATGSGSYEQGDTAFGDIRIGGYNFGSGNATLATAFMPPQVNNYSIAGNVTFNTGQTFNIGTAYNLFTVAAHEFGHALGLNHGAIGSMMASVYPGTLTALTADDIDGIRAIYGGARAGDAFDAAAANDSQATPSLVTSRISTATGAGVINNLDLTTSADADWYKFVVPAGCASTLRVRAVATGLSLLDPQVEIYTRGGVRVAGGSAGSYGGTAAASYSGIAAGQAWFVKVSSADARAAFRTGRYALVLNAGAGPNPAVVRPSTQTANGTPLTSGGGSAVGDGVETLLDPSSPFGRALGASLQVGTASGPVEQEIGAVQVATDAAGNFVVAWVADGEDGGGLGVYAQRFTARGLARGAAFRINSTTAGDQCAPAVAVRPDGAFVVTWQGRGGDGSWGVYARRFDAAGASQGREFRVDAAAGGDQLMPAVGFSTNGTYVIAWAGNDSGGSWAVSAQRFSVDGHAVGRRFRAGAAVGDQLFPVVGLSGAGSFTIAWSGTEPGTPGAGWDAYAQRFTAGGTPKGSELVLNGGTAGDQFVTGLAMAPDGTWAAVWTGTGPADDGSDVYARRYGGSGVPLAPEFRVNTTTAGDQSSPSVAIDSSGNLYATWSSYGQDAPGGWGVYGQQYSSSGAAIGSEFRVNTVTAGDQVTPSAAMDSRGHLVVVWNGAVAGGSDGVFMQRYSVNTSAEVPAVGDSWAPSSAGAGAQRPRALTKVLPPGLLPPGPSGAAPSSWWPAVPTGVTVPISLAPVLSGGPLGPPRNEPADLRFEPLPDPSDTVRDLVDTVAGITLD